MFYIVSKKPKEEINLHYLPLCGQSFESWLLKPVWALICHEKNAHHFPKPEKYRTERGEKGFRNKIPNNMNKSHKSNMYQKSTEFYGHLNTLLTGGFLQKLTPVAGNSLCK